VAGAPRDARGAGAQARRTPTSTMPTNATPRIVVADESAATIALVRELFTEYAAHLGHDLAFQDFTQELALLPGKYAQPSGAILVAGSGAVVDPGACSSVAPDRASPAVAAGCVALRAIGDPAERCAEMKRLWVRPQWRRTGLGRRLAEASIECARQKGYAAMRLDTLATMGPAVNLYRSLGFREIPAYYDNPLDDVVYFELKLWPAG
jgi:putative acetyltransferase